MNNGLPMPMVGLGTYKMLRENVEVAIPAAIDCGYRLFDTATIYRNEEDVGRVLGQLISSGKVSRSDIFVISKLQTADQGYGSAKKAIEASRQKLNLEYIDCYLIHWPGASGLDPSDPRNKEMRAGSWRALEEALDAGFLRSIGVSNYMHSHLAEMEVYAKVMPMVNQIELHPLYYPEDTIEYCQRRGIFVQAYSSLGRGKLLEETFLAAHPKISEMARLHGKEPSQVYLKWALQHSFGILPKSISASRVQSNIDLFDFELGAAEMQYLDALHFLEEQKICWDPRPVA